MVEVSYYCPDCGAVTSIDRAPTLRDGSVTRRPKPGRAYAVPTDDVEAADGIEFVCLGDVDGTNLDNQSSGTDTDPGTSQPVAADSVTTVGGRADGPMPGKDGCGRTFYLNYYRSPADDRDRA